MKTRFRRPRAAQDAPKEAQEAARTAPERPGPKGRPGLGPSPGEAHQGPPGALEWPSGGPKWVPREARERLKKGPGEAQHTTQEGTRAEKPRREDTSGGKTTEDKTRGKTRQQTDKRSSGATKPRTPWPVSNLLLVHLMHGSTLVYIFALAASVTCGRTQKVGCFYTHFSECRAVS